MKPKVLVILGPTASGKSSLAVELAKRFNGEVVSADSRQVYRGLDLGTGKITHKEMQGIPHHLLDVASPNDVLTVAEYKELADTAITEITSRGKLPILCGGTGFYIEAVADGVVFPEVPANKELRERLDKLSAEELLKMLEMLDADRAQELDVHNKTKIVRAIEIAQTLGNVPEVKKTHPYDVLLIGIVTPDDELRLKIKTRLTDRINKGMIDEVKKLNEEGLSFPRMNELGLEYRYVAMHLKGELTTDQLIETLTTKIWQYARRQKTWFRRDKRIEWVTLENVALIEKRVSEFLTK